jgi:pectate lyase
LLSACAAVALLSTASLAQTSLPAFPGAEGEGAYVSGGRGGDVYHVTTLDDSGPGSLRQGLESATGPRTIVFDVGGVIALNDGLSVSKPDITVAGQTAPGAGICIIYHGLLVHGPNVILQHVRVRPGDGKKGTDKEKGFSGDSISLWGSRIIVDHCSATWSIDENLSSADPNFHEVTVQNCIIAEGLHHTGLWHGRWRDIEGHSMGSLIKPIKGDGIITIHHCLYAGNDNRNPAVGSYGKDQSMSIDFRNNVIYNCQANGYSSGQSKWLNVNYVGNCIIAGPVTAERSRQAAFTAHESNNVSIYQSGNKIDGNRNGKWDGVDTGWDMIHGEYRRCEAPFPMGAVTTGTADAAYKRVLEDAGACPWNRDGVDARIINDVIKGTGRIIDSQNDVGGYPTLPMVSRPAGFDTDGDGMPDQWEKSHGCNPGVPDNNGDVNGNGYTNLEEYLFSIPEASAAASKAAAATGPVEGGR